ncbi:hypothetical protein BH23BAC1_BH23BAC1_21240 [soil metagenome]
MKVSVIIPTKNRWPLLKETLLNILQQTLPPYEIIVVDDGSEDGTEENITTQFKDKILYIKNKGQGPGAARNTGFQIATGNLIQFFDSDDFMTYNKLEVQSKKLMASGKGMIYGPYVKAYQDQTGSWIQQDVIMNYFPLPSSYGMDIWGLRGWCIITQACLFDHNLIKDVGLWRTDLMPHEDKEYLYRIGKLEKFPLHENETGVIYRQHGSQITDNHTNGIHRAYDCLQAFILIEKQISEDPDLVSKMIFESRLYNAVTYLGNQNEDVSLFSSYTTIGKKLKSLFYRFYSKIERMKTRSNWETMHGINASEEEFSKILNLFKI